ncbi:hypothetical protein TanjilG_15576 [Lupinus angustifolius]|uniref:uncharacterized protein LOC109335210 n=1 Tax=Lupinus angustifolius TaxID=3871 RepID=UPI00090DAE93|nr:PREDICTED: uncharacterized protein LOC109335210 [Lupinus angustifolius]OIV90843.1 hypothetical protein TanjilG_15576 [Lupinus angustifolius]
MAVLYSTLVSLQNPNPTINITKSFFFTTELNLISKRHLILQTSLLCIPQVPVAQSSAQVLQSKPLLSSIENTKSWFQFYGDGFSIRVPPEFQDIMEPEDYNAGLSLYGDKVKPKSFAARFSSPDGSEVLSVVTRPTNQLKVTFLEAQDITDLGSLRDAAKLFVPGGSTLYSARPIKIKEDGLRTYYFYEFGRYDQRVALLAGVSRGKAITAGATAPQSKWDIDGVKLRSAAVSLKIT